jgi:hypothetical protein
MLNLLRNLFVGYKFPKEIKGVYPYFEFCYSKESKYCVNFWKSKNFAWQVGEIIPMFIKDNKVAYYKIIRCYYETGNSGSDWAWGDDGKYRDMKLHHVELSIKKGRDDLLR